MREVAEELGMGSRATKSRLEKDPKDKLTGGFRDGRISEEEMEDWVFLGKYRTSTNRGGGFVYDYFLKNAVPVAPNGGTSKFKGSGEGEKQNLLKLTIPETVAAVKNGEVQEVKWTNALRGGTRRVSSRNDDDLAGVERWLEQQDERPPEVQSWVAL